MCGLKHGIIYETDWHNPKLAQDLFNVSTFRKLEIVKKHRWKEKKKRQ